MNLYLVERNEDCDWDEYDSLVVCAKSYADAKKIHPAGDVSDNWWKEKEQYDWKYKKLSATLIGKAKEGMERGAVLTSFNAG